jgi:hypothetical protein
MHYCSDEQSCGGKFCGDTSGSEHHAGPELEKLSRAAICGFSNISPPGRKRGTGLTLHIPEAALREGIVIRSDIHICLFVCVTETTVQPDGSRKSITADGYRRLSITKHARKDARELAAAGLKEKAQGLLRVLEENPCNCPASSSFAADHSVRS